MELQVRCRESAVLIPLFSLGQPFPSAVKSGIGMDDAGVMRLLPSYR